MHHTAHGMRWRARHQSAAGHCTLLRAVLRYLMTAHTCTLPPHRVHFFTLNAVVKKKASGRSRRASGSKRKSGENMTENSSERNDQYGKRGIVGRHAPSGAPQAWRRGGMVSGGENSVAHHLSRLLASDREQQAAWRVAAAEKWRQHVARGAFWHEHILFRPTDRSYRAIKHTRTCCAVLPPRARRNTRCCCALPARALRTRAQNQRNKRKRKASKETSIHMASAKWQLGAKNLA